MGLVSPSIIIPKTLIQKLWLQKLAWDDAVPFELASVWLKYRQQLHTLVNLIIPRKVICSSPAWIDLHEFCDASTLAFGACIYVVSSSDTGQVLTTLYVRKVG